MRALNALFFWKNDKSLLYVLAVASGLALVAVNLVYALLGSGTGLNQVPTEALIAMKGGMSHLHEVNFTYGYGYALFLKVLGLFIPTTTAPTKIACIIKTLQSLISLSTLGFLIFRVVRNYKGTRLAFIAVTIFLADPVQIISNDWLGQIHFCIASLGLLCFYLAWKNRAYLPAVALAIACSLSAEALYLLPVLVIFLAFKQGEWLALLLLPVLLLAVFLPFHLWGHFSLEQFLSPSPLHLISNFNSPHSSRDMIYLTNKLSLCLPQQAWVNPDIPWLLKSNLIFGLTVALTCITALVYKLRTLTNNLDTLKLLIFLGLFYNCLLAYFIPIHAQTGYASFAEVAAILLLFLLPKYWPAYLYIFLFNINVVLGDSHQINHVTIIFDCLGSLAVLVWLVKIIFTDINCFAREGCNSSSEVKTEAPGYSKNSWFFMVASTVLIILLIAAYAVLWGYTSKDIISFNGPWLLAIHHHIYPDRIPPYLNIDYGFFYTNLLRILAALVPPSYDFSNAHTNAMFTLVMHTVVTFPILIIISYKFLRPYLSKATTWLAIFCLLASPVIIVDTFFLGQTDVMLGTLILLSVYLLAGGKVKTAVLVYSLAYGIKLTAVFFLPVLIIFLVINRHKLSHLWIIPLVYLLLFLPCYWSYHLPWKYILRPFQHQLHQNTLLSSDLANLGMYIKTSLGSQLTKLQEMSLKYILITLTFVTIAITFVFCLVKFRAHGKVMDLSFLLKLTLWIGYVIPFLLPAQHERYYVVMAFLSASLYVLIDPKKWYILVLLFALCMFSLVFRTVPAEQGADILSIILFSLIAYDFFFDSFKSASQIESLPEDNLQREDTLSLKSCEGPNLNSGNIGKT